MRDYLQSYNLLSKEDIDSIEEQVVLKRIPKGEFFIQEGSISKEVAFIKSGFFRSYYHNSRSEEITYCFTFANAFLSAYSSYLTQAPTSENIQAMVDVEMFCISREEILRLEESNPNWLKLLKVIAEQEYVKMEKRIFLLQKESAEMRYQDLMINHPEYLQHIPLNYLSSYLGITQRHLSRIRKSFQN
ncbi:MAG: Crp/Fnr family transcriptional regulator [Bacteroidia bacterium]|nr:Crp/Fnr family transcriptional regulator [Bacteroidia bacterium]